MRKMLFIDIRYQDFFSRNKSNATGKPRIDAQKISEIVGFEPHIIKAYERKSNGLIDRVLYYTSTLLVFIKLCTFLRFSNKVFLFQLPCPSNVLYTIFGALKKRNNKIIILIHDVSSLRFNTAYQREDDALKQADVIIVHSKDMELSLKSMGVNCKFVDMKFFDYLTDYNGFENDCKEIQVVYAGNLAKSPFLNELDNVDDLDKYSYHLYGVGAEHLNIASLNVKYMGAFESDHINGVKGTWGLVWDGDKTDTCSGNFGEYLKINAPFKFSLSLALGMPLIVWKESAMAKNVEALKLGICIEGLNDIYKTIRSLSEDDLSKIKNNVIEYSLRVRRGDMLKSALNEALKDLEVI